MPTPSRGLATAKESMARFGRNVWGLALVSLLVTIGFSAANLVIPYYILALKGVLTEVPERLAYIPAHRAVLEMGILSSSFMATRAVVAAASGWISDRVGRKRVIVAGMSLYVVVGVLYAFTTSVWQLYLLRALQGIASAMVWPVAETLLVESVDPSYRARALSIYIVSMNVGNVAGPFVGALAYAASVHLLAGYPVVDVLRAPFLLIAVSTLPGLAVTLTLRETLRRGHASHRRILAARLSSLEKSQKMALYAFYANGLVNGFAMGLVSSVMMVYVIEYVVKDPTALGALMGVSGLIGMLAAYPLAHVSDRLSPTGRKTALIGWALVGRTTMAVIGLVRDPLQLLALLSLGSVTFNAMMPLLRSVQASLVPGELRGRVFGLQQAFFNTGMVVGPLVGAYLYRMLHGATVLGLPGTEIVFLLAGILGYIGAALIAVYYRPLEVEEAVRRRLSA